MGCGASELAKRAQKVSVTCEKQPHIRVEHFSCTYLTAHKCTDCKLQPDPAGALSPEVMELEANWKNKTDRVFIVIHCHQGNFQKSSPTPLKARAPPTQVQVQLTLRCDSNAILLMQEMHGQPASVQHIHPSVSLQHQVGLATRRQAGQRAEH